MIDVPALRNASADDAAALHSLYSDYVSALRLLEQLEWFVRDEYEARNTSPRPATLSADVTPLEVADEARRFLEANG